MRLARIGDRVRARSHESRDVAHRAIGIDHAKDYACGNIVGMRSEVNRRTSSTSVVLVA
jgi:hypothetical protein